MTPWCSAAGPSLFSLSQASSPVLCLLGVVGALEEAVLEEPILEVPGLEVFSDAFDMASPSALDLLGPQASATLEISIRWLQKSLFTMATDLLKLGQDFGLDRDRDRGLERDLDLDLERCLASSTWALHLSVANSSSSSWQRATFRNFPSFSFCFLTFSIFS